MELSYYTIDDLRQGQRNRGVTGWCLEQFSSWREALEHYRALPWSGVKVLGVNRGAQVLDLVRCVPLFPEDICGEDVLAADEFSCPEWHGERSVRRLAQECVRTLGIRYCLLGRSLVPAPERFPNSLRDKYLWGARPGDPSSAVRWVYVAGSGWLSPEEFKKRYSQPETGDFHRPLVIKCQVDGLTRSGQYIPLEVSPWDLRRLERRTLDRLEQNLKERRSLA